MARTTSEAGAAPPVIPARTAMSAVIGYQLLLLLLIPLRPDLDPSWHTISEWAIGPHGWLMTVAFLASALAYGAAFVMLRGQVRGRSGRIGHWLLLACAVGTAGVGLFRTDPMDGPPRMPSTTGALHIVSGTTALVLLPFAALLLNLSLASREGAWSTRRSPLRLTAGLPLLGFAGFAAYTAFFVVPLGPGARGPGVHIGWPPRVALLCYAIWLVTLAWQALRLRRVPST